MTRRQALDNELARTFRAYCDALAAYPDWRPHTPHATDALAARASENLARAGFRPADLALTRRHAIAKESIQHARRAHR